MKIGQISSAHGLVAILVVFAALTGCAVNARPPGPVAGETTMLPEGAVPRSRGTWSPDEGLSDSLSRALRNRFEGELERDGSGRPVFRVLTLSGGGSQGAFGAGVLVGWSDAGERPKFDIVTGVSTGALMATFAFLGPEYDHILRSHSRLTNTEVFTDRPPFAGLFFDALRDTQPLRELIAREIDEEVLAAVAREHAKGRRLFIATTNLDAGTLTTWDLGEIASSSHPGALQRYRDVILASASFPLLFPPVYIPLDMDGNSHSQMHVDGSIRSNVFAASFMLDLDNALRRSRLSAEDVREELWVIHNGQAPSLRNDPVDPQAMTIAEASINNLLEVMSRSSVSELYTLAMVHGFAFSYASIPPSFQLGPSPLEFDQEEMQQLFELGYEGGRSGNIWQRQQAPAEPFELLQVLDPELLRIASGHYPHIPHRPPRWIHASEPLVEPVRLTLCSGGRYGNYYRVAQKIREQLAPMNLQVVVLTTEGSIDNLGRFVSGRCDAAIAQHDAYFLHLYSDDRGLGIGDQQRPKYLFDDYVHVVCNAKAGVERLEQLAEDPEKHRMLIGSRRSGSAATWEVLKRVDQRYQAVPTEPIGGDAALAMVAANDRPACMLFVASLQTPLIRQANEEGTDLNLVSVEPDAGYYVEIAGERIYRIDHFEPGTYENLQSRLARTDVPTVSVGVSLIVSTAWAREHPAANRLLSSAVAQARQYLLESIERNQM